jgi:dipeptidyl aminopeptidase/acylaminoacyl peptidase
MHDLTCAIRFLRAKATRFGVDTERVGVVGGSAGGHLAQMVGVNNGSRAFDGGGYTNERSDVQAVVSLWGVSDLTRNDLGPSDRQKLPSVFGKARRWAAASPVHYVRAGLPPFLLVHGSRDSDVPVAQSKRMFRALQAVNVPATLVVVRNAEHRLKPVGGYISPSEGSVVDQVANFFTWAFKRPGAATAGTPPPPPVPAFQVPAAVCEPWMTDCGPFGLLTRLWPLAASPEAP